MKTKKILRLIEAVENEEVLKFNFSVIREGNCGCALGTARQLFLKKSNDIICSSEPFTEAQKLFGISTVAAEILFNNIGGKLRTSKGVVHNPGGFVTKEQWAAHAREFVRIKTKDKE